jgi:hypothetical protein
VARLRSRRVGIRRARRLRWSSAATASRHEMCGLWRRRLDIAQWRGTVARAARSEPSFIQVKAAVIDRMRAVHRCRRSPRGGKKEGRGGPCGGRSNSRVHLVRVARSSPRPNAMQMRKPRRAGFGVYQDGQLGLLWGRLELSQRRAQRIKPRGVGKFVVFDGAPEGRCYRGKFVVGEVNCRHGPDIIGRHLSSKKRDDLPRGARFTDLWRGAAAKARSV